MGKLAKAEAAEVKRLAREAKRIATLWRDKMATTAAKNAAERAFADYVDGLTREREDG